MNTPSYILILFAFSGPTTTIDHLDGFASSNACVLAGTQIVSHAGGTMAYECLAREVGDREFELNMKALLGRVGREVERKGGAPATPKPRTHQG